MAQISAKPASASAIDNHVYKAFPNDLNAHHTVFGGLVMSICDRIALLVSERHSGKTCVTASVDSMHFRAPARDGETLIFKAAINRSWSSSMEIGVKVLAENSFKGEERHIVSAYFTFVALNESHEPTEVPEVISESECEKRRYEHAEIRRNARLRTRKELKESRG